MEAEELAVEIAKEIRSKIENFLKEKDREYRERAKIGVKIKRDLWTYMAYEVEIGGLWIHIEKDGRNHRWEFKDENTSIFYTVSEKKGEAIIEFLEVLAKLSSQSGPSQGEESFVSQGEENFAGAAPDPRDLGEKNFAGGEYGEE